MNRKKWWIGLLIAAAVLAAVIFWTALFYEDIPKEENGGTLVKVCKEAAVYG